MIILIILIMIVGTTVVYRAFTYMCQEFAAHFTMLCVIIVSSIQLRALKCNVITDPRMQSKGVVR